MKNRQVVFYRRVKFNEQRKHRYLVMPSSWIQNKKLSDKGLRVLCYVFDQNSSTFKVGVRQVKTAFGWSEATCTKVFKELVNLGYLERKEAPPLHQFFWYMIPKNEWEELPSEAQDIGNPQRYERNTKYP